MNQIEMTSDDKEKRWKEANTPNKVSAERWHINTYALPMAA